jgi:hypothetical protein
MLLSSPARLGEVGHDFQSGFTEPRLQELQSSKSAPLSFTQKAPAIAGRRLEIKPFLFYCGAGVAFGFL